MSTRPSKSQLAYVEQATSKSAPVLHPGEITPAALRDWAEACEAYCENKSDLKAEDYVRKIAYGMRDNRLRDWYRVNKTRLNALSLDAYIEEMKKKYLRPDWEDELRRQIFASSQGEQSFWDWQNSLQSTNCLLRGTPSHFTDSDIRKHLDAHMHPELTALCTREKARKVEKLDDWLEAVRILDEHRLEDEKKMFRLFQKSKSTTTTRTTSSTTQNAPSSTSTAPRKLPKMTPAERDLLSKNKGCFKCRRINVDHVSTNCPNGYPNPDTYRPPTDGDASNAVSNTQRARAPMRAPAPVASIVEEKEDLIAVVMPAAVLDSDGPDTDDD
ncbi:hypothetical protein NEOLEDRAFT_1152831 [Neolentinus lepideus HHB14362 ss-1]|uniref:Retrotransposon gag domain-containing protein n=1 Tax=Neolentinus lepideus HHB14362 ss-1 TaxID=1314782 RepID=A0A165M828_9AGAM|nr:hypothetical protein NEOLEDRAFT_1152831 [Neolentinus lepideus HHB14362 ss-1]